MKAILFERFQETPKRVTVDDPSFAKPGVILKVTATDVSCSDGHGWVAHDSDTDLPHIPRHELAGVVLNVAPEAGSAP